MKKRIFIQSACKYPHGTPGANYLESFSKLFVECGFEVVFITNRNQDYSLDEIVEIEGIQLEWIEEKEDELEKLLQTRTGYADDRIDVLKKWGINQKDYVFVYGLNHPTFQDQLIRFTKKIGAKLWCFVMEFMKEKKDIPIDRQYQLQTYWIPKYYDGIIGVSDFILNYYSVYNIKSLKIPPMVSYEGKYFKKKTDICRVILPFNGLMKDDLESILKGLALLNIDVLKRIHIDLMGVRREQVKDILKEDYSRLITYITIHKWMKYEDLMRLYKKARVIILPRKVNQMTVANFPSKIPEAMKYGIIPIVSDVGDYTKYYLKDNKNSIVMKGSSPEECARSLRRLIDMNPVQLQYIEAEVYKTVKYRFDYHVWVETLKKEFDCYEL